MGFVADVVGGVMGGGAKKGAASAPQSNFQAQYRELGDDQRQGYAQKIAQAQNGQGPSVANQYVAQAQENSLANALSMAASARGGVSPGAAYRQALNAAAAGSQNAVRQGALMRAQEGIDMTKLYEQLGMSGDIANQEAFGKSQGLNAGIAQSNLQAQSEMAKQSAGKSADMFGGLVGSLGSAAMPLALGALTGGAAPVAMGAMGGMGGSGMGAMMAYDGGMVSIADALRNGGYVPGRANVPGDSPQNDKVHALLSPGEVVVPRSLVEDPERAKKFIEQISKNKKKASYQEVLAARSR